MKLTVTISKYINNNVMFICCWISSSWLITIGWGKWGHYQIDYGREVYLPWRIFEGSILYKDVVSYFGPLSPNFNALMFSLFGVHLWTIQIINLLIMVLLSYLIWKISLKIAPRFNAIILVLTFIYTVGLNNAETLGNYNFMTPYSNDLTHGYLLAFCILLIMSKPTGSWPTSRSILCGALFGLLFLTKSEIFIAMIIATSAAVLLNTVKSLVLLKSNATFTLLFLIGFATPITATLLIMSNHSSLKFAIDSISFMYMLPFNLPNPFKIFYLSESGLDNIIPSIRSILISFLLNALIFTSVWFTGYVASKLKQSQHIFLLITILAALSVTYLYIIPHEIRFLIATRWVSISLPLYIAVFIAIYLIKPIKSQYCSNYFVLIVFIFSFMLITKIILNARLLYYGTLLAFPMLMIYVLAVTLFIPAIHKKNILAFRLSTLSGVVIILLLFSPKVIQSITNFHNAKYFTITTDTGYIAGNDKLLIINDLLLYLTTHVKQSSSLAVLPEGVMINFLLKMPNPTPFINLCPPEWSAFDGHKIEKAYSDNPPNWIILLSRPMREYGEEGFCISYGNTLCEWIQSNYTQVITFGEVPFVRGKSGAILLKNNRYDTTINQQH